MKYQDYSKDALQQLRVKLKRKRHHPHLVYEQPNELSGVPNLQGTLGANASVSMADMML